MSMIGKNLGHYSVSTMLGKGGMGEVYKAKDQKLGRNVAVKYTSTSSFTRSTPWRH
jgi:serine/threonine protein kinase